ncbi:GTP cyclohydrolase 1 type 2 homolog YbgI [hydrothermal vent metagenome]|uniref:GTP cyclohydrolase 1 type 2 homolog YbgI n=1 Tax=hydrothermal vent metagenome TaxID=652676 RepID=A0A3B1BPX8_9ZZZZ
MVKLPTLEAYCNTLLDVGSYTDYCPNGLQVDAGQNEVKRLVTGVTASQALVDEAVAAGADVLLVHHGYFWQGEADPLTGIKGCRIRTLIKNNISLLAYHLPLDAHPELGNNCQLADRLGFATAQPVGDGLIWQTDLTQPIDAADLSRRIAKALDREPQYISSGNQPVRRIGWCSGAAQDYIEAAADLEIDAFITGEISERTVHLARELGIHFYAAGHHATERFGVQALGGHLAEQFSLDHRFIDIANPV